VAEELYANAPLVEVIAEVRWPTIGLGALPGAALDPHFEVTAQELTGVARQLGYVHVETLVPNEVPRELLAGQPVFRFRKQPGKWPLFQLGPGIFSVNIVPPYGGWSAFRPDLEAAIGALLSAYPAPTKLFKPNHVSLRYMDAFTVAHGRVSAADFVKSGLSIDLKMPPRFQKDLKLGEAASISVETIYDLASPVTGKLQLKILPGTKDGREATVMELTVGCDGSGVTTDKDGFMLWFDSAHQFLRETFEAIASDQLKTKMGPKVKVS
jgi:uncharacterized protein (TIGR04255 family)